MYVSKILYSMQLIVHNFYFYIEVNPICFTDFTFAHFLRFLCFLIHLNSWIVLLPQYLWFTAVFSHSVRNLHSFPSFLVTCIFFRCSLSTARQAFLSSLTLTLNWLASSGFEGKLWVSPTFVLFEQRWKESWFFNPLPPKRTVFLSLTSFQKFKAPEKTISRKWGFRNNDILLRVQS